MESSTAVAGNDRQFNLYIRYYRRNIVIKTILDCLEVWRLIIPHTQGQTYQSSEQADLLSSPLNLGRPCDLLSPTV